MGPNPTHKKDNPEATEHKVYLLIRELWHNGTGNVDCMHVVNTDTKYYLEKTPGKCLQEAARSKKNVYVEACLQQRCHFSPFFASADGLLNVEAAAILKRIAIHLATKWQKPY